MRSGERPLRAPFSTPPSTADTRDTSRAKTNAPAVNSGATCRRARPAPSPDARPDPPVTSGLALKPQAVTPPAGLGPAGVDVRETGGRPNRRNDISRCAMVLHHAQRRRRRGVLGRCSRATGLSNNGWTRRPKALDRRAALRQQMPLGVTSTALTSL
jgi:hypothetical protein